jgi:hypothetical protein
VLTVKLQIRKCIGYISQDFNLDFTKDRPILSPERTDLMKDRPILSPKKTDLMKDRPILSPERTDLMKDTPILSPERTDPSCHQRGRPTKTNTASVVTSPKGG